MLNKKVLSIIVISKNNLDDFMRTLNSLFPFYQEKSLIKLFEIIIVDKSDNKEIKNAYFDLKKSTYKNLIYIKQCNDGIFFGFNIGINEASGNYLWFLNAGDRFAYLIDIKVFFNKLLDYRNSIIIYKTIILGKLLNINIGTQPIFIPRNIFVYRLLNLFFPFAFGYCHQSILFSNNFHKRNLYKFPNMLGQDSKLVQKALNQKQYKYIDLPLSYFYLGGASSKSPENRKYFLRVLKDRLKNLQFYSTITLIIKYFLFKNPFYLERVIYYRNKLIMKIFSYMNFLK